MGMLAAACAFFFLLHIAVSGTAIRGALVGLMGEGIYTIAFSVLSLGGLWWMAMAYNAALLGDNPYLWSAPIGLLHSASILVFIAFLFMVIGLTTPSPTVVQGERLLAQNGPPAKGILTITRHPFLWGVVLWGLTHVAVNGDGASTLLFGTLVLTALLGTRSIDHKRARSAGEAWDRFASATSNLPFARALSGGGIDWAGIGLWRPLVAIVLFGALLWLHTILFKVSPIPGAF